MILLAIDPGETTGMVLFRYACDSSPLRLTGYHPEILDHGDIPTPDLADAALCLSSLLPKYKPDVIVVEDYRVYQQYAKVHIGDPLHTAKLIGVIIGVVSTLSFATSLVLIPASKKGRWPEKRLERWFPAISREIHGHSRDALKIGLAYLEQLKEEESNA